MEAEISCFGFTTHSSRARPMAYLIELTCARVETVVTGPPFPPVVLNDR